VFLIRQTQKGLALPAVHPQQGAHRLAKPWPSASSNGVYETPQLKMKGRKRMSAIPARQGMPDSIGRLPQPGQELRVSL